MDKSNPPLRYGTVAITFHWAIAALILFDLCLAMSFDYFNPGDILYFASAYQLHIAIGMIALLLSVARVAWRLMHEYPPAPASMNLASRLVAKATHVLLYFCILAVPLSGWAIVSVRRQPAALLGSVDWPNISWLADMTREQRKVVYAIVKPGHLALTYLAIGLVALHIAAALYHHLYRRDDVLRRMLPRSTLRPCPDSKGL